MRTHILIAAALILSATASHAASRSLSGAQTNPIGAPAQKVQVLEAPAPKVQVLETPQAIEQPRVEQALEQPKDPSKAAAQAAPVETAPERAAPIEDGSVATVPAEAAPATAPAEANSAPGARPVKEARRKPSRRHPTTEQQIERELRNIGRTIERHIGFALSNATLYHW